MDIWVSDLSIYVFFGGGEQEGLGFSPQAGRCPAEQDMQLFKRRVLQDQIPSDPTEHPCPNHDKVQIRLHPIPQSIHGPAMTTSR